MITEGNIKKIQNKSKNLDVATRGKTFQGYVLKKFNRRVVVDFERVVYVKKYKAFYKKRVKLHARLPVELDNVINVGDFIEIKECRKLSKLVNFIVTKKIREVERK